MRRIETVSCETEIPGLCVRRPRASLRLRGLARRQAAAAGVKTRSLTSTPSLRASDDMEYEDYTSTSKVYDTTRVPIGLVRAFDKSNNDNKTKQGITLELNA
eukprot:COSAG03_NODE_344_length_8812_cov_3.890049_5_plen_102_part_00